MRAIDADKLLRDLVELERVLGTENADLSEHQRLAIMATFGMVNALVRRSKTVDTESVIRCKDCVNRGTMYINMEPVKWRCMISDSVVDMMDYCSFAERKEE